MAALITRMKRPSVTTVIGSVRMTASGRTNALTMPRRAAAASSVAPVSKVIPETTCVATHRPMAAIAARTRKPSIVKLLGRSAAARVGLLGFDRSGKFPPLDQHQAHLAKEDRPAEAQARVDRIPLLRVGHPRPEDTQTRRMSLHDEQEIIDERRIARRQARRLEIHEPQAPVRFEYVDLRVARSTILAFDDITAARTRFDDDAVGIPP